MMILSRRETVQISHEILKGKSQRARRAYITKAINDTKAHIEILKVHEANDHTLYLGETVFMHLLQAERDLDVWQEFKAKHY